MTTLASVSCVLGSSMNWRAAVFVRPMTWAHHNLALLLSLLSRHSAMNPKALDRVAFLSLLSRCPMFLSSAVEAMVVGRIE